ncbi:MAG: hypothetical protein FWE37_07715 [Spirochaetaceae bacterium]|nr:hypothetical protein [Spirochaetaceae bacterium]
MKILITILLLTVGLFTGCRVAISEVPQIIEAKVLSPYEVELNFTAAVSLQEVTLYPPQEFTVNNNRILFTGPMQIGQFYRLSAQAVSIKNMGRHRLHFAVSFMAYNDNLPKLIFNEITPIHSAVWPERIELYVVEGGNLAGIALYLGTAANHTAGFVLPDMVVTAGDYLVIQARDNDDPRHNGNLRWPGLVGLPNNGAVLTLYENMAATAVLIDGVAYRNGSFQLTDELEEAIAELNLYVIDSAGTTATRSLSRQPDGSWFVVVTGGQTFGAANSNRRFTN